MLTRVQRQKRRLAVLAFGGLLAVFAALGPALGIVAFVLVLGTGAAVIVYAPQHRSWLETVGLGLTVAVGVAQVLPFSTLLTVPVLGAGFIAATRYALYGPWAERVDLWLPLTVSQTRQVAQPPRAVWAAAAPGGGLPEEVFPGSVEEVFVDQDDPETVYLAHYDGREDTYTFLSRKAPDCARFMRTREDDPREALVELRISEFSLGHSYIVMTETYDHLRPAEWFGLFFDDALGDEMDSLAAWLEGRTDDSLFALEYKSAPPDRSEGDVALAAE